MTAARERLPLPSHYMVEQVTQPVDQASCAIYLRISKDVEQTGLGVERQEDICREEAVRRAWAVFDIYIDNDITASKRKVKRPSYDRMVRDIEAGRVNAIVVYSSERLTRQPRQNEDVLDWAEEKGLLLASARGFIDLSTAEGKRQFRVAGAQAAYESEVTSQRLKDKFDQKAMTGEPHGAVPYGWVRESALNDKGRQVRTQDVLDPEPASAIRFAANALLDGRSLRSVAKDMNERGWDTGKGHKWSSHLLSQVILRPRNAGLRVHRGQIVAMGTWTPIYDTGTHDRLVALLTDPSRRTTLKGNERRHLLSGIIVCGVCGSKNIGVLVRPEYQERTYQPTSYYCRDNRCLGRKQAPVDAMVRAQMIDILQDPHAMDRLVIGDPAAVQQAHMDKAAAAARKEHAFEQWNAGKWGQDRLAKVDAANDPIIAGAEQVISASLPPALPTDFCGPDAEIKWDAADLETKRNLIQAFITVTLLRTTFRGRAGFDPSAVQILPTSVWATDGK